MVRITIMQWHTLHQDLGKTRQGEETREEAGAGRKVVWRVHAEAKKKRKRGKETRMFIVRFLASS